MYLSKKYGIYIFKNKVPYKKLAETNVKENILKKWDDFLKKEPTPYPVEVVTRGKKVVEYELGLIIPSNKHSKSYIYIDSRTKSLKELFLEDKDHKIKRLVPYYIEEKIYDFNIKKRVPFSKFFTDLLKIKSLTMVFSLNKNIIVQTEDDIKLFGNKTKKDSYRLIDTLREETIKLGRTNLMFVKDINTPQRIKLYELLESHGFDKKVLLRHY